MAAIGAFSIPMLNQPHNIARDFTFTDIIHTVEINHDMNVGHQSISVVGSSIFVPQGVTIRAKQIQFFVYDPNGEIDCQGKLICNIFLTNTQRCHIHSQLHPNGGLPEYQYIGN